MLVAGLGAFTVGLVIGGLAPSMGALVLGRVVQGVGAGMESAASFATIALAFGPSERSKVLALLSLAWLLPSVVGPIVGGLVAAAFGWRWVFLGLAVLMPACALLVIPQVRALPRPVAGPPAGLRHALRWAVPPAGQVRLAASVLLLASMAVLGAVSFAPLALTDVRGLDRLAAGITIAILSVCWSVATFLEGRLRTVTTAMVTRRGLALILVGLPVVALTAVPEVPMPVTWLGWALCGLGAGFAFQGSNLHVMVAAPAGAEGRATASAQLASTVGNGVGTWLGGVLLAATLAAGVALSGSLGLVFGACLVAAGAGLAVATRLRPVAAGHGAADHCARR